MTPETLFRKFTKGWAIQLFSGRRAHWFVADPSEVAFGISVCGLPAIVASLRAEGAVARCKNCERLLPNHKEPSHA